VFESALQPGSTNQKSFGKYLPSYSLQFQHLGPYPCECLFHQSESRNTRDLISAVLVSPPCRCLALHLFRAPSRHIPTTDYNHERPYNGCTDVSRVIVCLFPKWCVLIGSVSSERFTNYTHPCPASPPLPSEAPTVRSGRRCLAFCAVVANQSHDLYERNAVWIINQNVRGS
jgi:hypothetical protein